MLPLNIPEREYYDDVRQEFVTCKAQSLKLEHSLISISKWESKWKKPFLEQKAFTIEELIDYVKCMTINPDVDPNAYLGLTQNEISQVMDYVNDKMTATWFSDKDNNRRGGKTQVVTSELIYFWMVSYEIPFSCEKWHLNRLLTLIRICEVKNQPKKKMNTKDIYARNKALNDARRKSLGTKG